MPQPFLREHKAKKATPLPSIRLLTHDKEGNLIFEVSKSPESTPPYAVLSHTWSTRLKDEISFPDLHSIAEAEQKPGFAKLTFLANRARADGLKHFWLDTCCVDRRDATELSNAINSMFGWHQRAAKCYAYLSDVSTEGNDGAVKEKFKQSRWFTRLWTLPGLLASPTTEFFSVEGKKIGDTTSLLPEIVAVTGIEEDVIKGARKLDEVDHGTRMSWAEKRGASVPEDAAYFLLGLFDVTMPLHHGEGKEKAMQRLKQEIKKSIKTNLREGDFSFISGTTGNGKTYACYLSRGLHFLLDRSESCFFCGGKGHYEPQCQTSEEELRRYRKEAGLCFQCGSVGHFEQFCPWSVERESL